MQLEPTDLIVLMKINNMIKMLVAKRENLHLQMEMINRDIAAAQNQANSINEQIKVKYQLEGNNNIDLETGEITKGEDQ